jgi:hypothetical protein
MSNHLKGYELHTICTDGPLESSPTAIAFEAIVTFKTRTIVETGVAFTFTVATWTYACKNNHAVNSYILLR